MAATCKACGSEGIIHGHVDRGHVDYYDNYYSLCPHCFWAYHEQHFAMSGSEEEIWRFDYSINTYRWPWT